MLHTIPVYDLLITSARPILRCLSRQFRRNHPIHHFHLLVMRLVPAHQGTIVLHSVHPLPKSAWPKVLTPAWACRRGSVIVDIIASSQRTEDLFKSIPENHHASAQLIRQQMGTSWSHSEICLFIHSKWLKTREILSTCNFWIRARRRVAYHTTCNLIPLHLTENWHKQTWSISHLFTLNDVLFFAHKQICDHLYNCIQRLPEAETIHWFFKTSW